MTDTPRPQKRTDNERLATTHTGVQGRDAPYEHVPIEDARLRADGGGEASTRDEESVPKNKVVWRLVALLSVPLGFLLGGMAGVLVLSTLQVDGLTRWFVIGIPGMLGVVLGTAVGSFAEVMA